MARVPALIVGGGPAGSAAAITLARAGLTPWLYESSAVPGEGVCGGFLGWDTLELLRKLGIDVRALGARPVTMLRLVTGNQTVESKLPHPAASLSRQTLDKALIAAAGAAGARVRCGRGARAADPVARSIRLDDGETIAGEALFLATGKHELRGLARHPVNRRAETSVGLRTALPPCAKRQQALAGIIELHLFDRGYAGLVLQEDGRANLCLSVARGRLAGGVRALMAEICDQAPCLADRLGDAPLRFAAVAGVPYGWQARTTRPGIFRIGDQGAGIASLAGDGIAIALGSGMGAAHAMLAGGPEAAMGWQADLRRKYRRPLAIAEILRQGAQRRIPRESLMRLLRHMPQLACRAALFTRAGS